MIVDRFVIAVQVVLTKRPSEAWALSAHRTICPAAVARGAKFSRRSPFTVPWYVFILRYFLPIAPGTDVTSYQAMMSGVLHKLDLAEKWGSSDVPASQGISDIDIDNLNLCNVLQRM